MQSRFFDWSIQKMRNKDLKPCLHSPRLFKSYRIRFNFLAKNSLFINFSNLSAKIHVVFHLELKMVSTREKYSCLTRARHFGVYWLDTENDFMQPVWQTPRWLTNTRLTSALNWPQIVHKGPRNILADSDRPVSTFSPLSLMLSALNLNKSEYMYSLIYHWLMKIKIIPNLYI